MCWSTRRRSERTCPHPQRGRRKKRGLSLEDHGALSPLFGFPSPEPFLDTLATSAHTSASKPSPPELPRSSKKRPSHSYLKTRNLGRYRNPVGRGSPSSSSPVLPLRAWAASRLFPDAAAASRASKQVRAATAVAKARSLPPMGVLQTSRGYRYYAGPPRSHGASS